ncbi:MAG: helix-turn-helix transcriptional regulator [Acidobacteria bacterium]|nr:helix-turn-helix transcriptional regulator [Acidobacteriota bacterium]
MKATAESRKARAERLAALLVEARREAGLTQVELAERLGRKQAYVSKYETGARGVDVLELMEIADVLSCDPAELLRKLR